MTINQGVDPRLQNADRFMELGRRLAKSFSQIDRANVQQKILEGLEALTKDAEFFAQIATRKRITRRKSRATRTK